MSPFLFSESSFAVLAASGKDRPCHAMRAWRSRTKRRRSWTSSPWNPTATRFQGNLWTLHAYVSVWTWNMDLFISYFSGKFDLYLRLTITIQITLHGLKIQWACVCTSRNGGSSQALSCWDIQGTRFKSLSSYAKSLQHSEVYIYILIFFETPWR